MAKLDILKIDGKYASFVNDSPKALDEETLNRLIEKMAEATITKATLDGDDLLLIIDGNDVRIKDYSSFLDDTKYQSFNNHIADYVEKQRKKEQDRIKSEKYKPRINRKKSVSTIIKRTSATIALLGLVSLAAYSFSKVVENLENSPKENYYTKVYVEPTAKPTEPILPRPTINVKFYSKEEFNEIVNNYAQESGINPDLIYWMLYNNSNYNEEMLNRYFTLINYIKYLSNEGFSIEIINSGHNSLSGIFATDYSRYVIIPENIEKMNSIVQFNPSGTSGYLCYENVLNDIRNGNIPSSIVVGSANSALDYNNSVNGNLLLKMIKFSLDNNINITNIGSLGYNNSGETAFLNVGNMLIEYPNMNVRIVNLDGFYITDFIEKLNGYLNGLSVENEKEITALLSSNVEVLSIFPQLGGYGISESRPEEALNESLYLENVFKGYHLATPITDYRETLLQAYQLGVINYLAGQISFDDLRKLYTESIQDNKVYDSINYHGNNYYSVNPTYNDTSSSDYTLYFGDITEGSQGETLSDDYLSSDTDELFDYSGLFGFDIPTEISDIPTESIDYTLDGKVNDSITF